MKKKTKITHRFFDIGQVGIAMGNDQIAKKNFDQREEENEEESEEEVVEEREVVGDEAGRHSDNHRGERQWHKGDTKRRIDHFR